MYMMALNMPKKTLRVFTANAKQRGAIRDKYDVARESVYALVPSEELCVCY